MKRGGPLGSDPEKQRAWQQRSANAYQARQREKGPQPRSKKTQRRRSDGPWRAEVLARYGRGCVVCGDARWVEADHIWPRSQGGPSDPRNGIPLCKEHHDDKTAGRLRFRPEWLLPDTMTYLADVGWVTWNDDGEPVGRGWRHFERMGGTA